MVLILYSYSCSSMRLAPNTAAPLRPLVYSVVLQYMRERRRKKRKIYKCTALKAGYVKKKKS